MGGLLGFSGGGRSIDIAAISVEVSADDTIDGDVSSAEIKASEGVDVDMAGSDDRRPKNEMHLPCRC